MQKHRIRNPDSIVPIFRTDFSLIRSQFFQNKNRRIFCFIGSCQALFVMLYHNKDLIVRLSVYFNLSPPFAMLFSKTLNAS